MIANYETGTYYNRGFVGTDTIGFCSMLDDWLTSSVALGGAGWTCIEDFSTVSSSTFTIPDHLNDLCLCVGHGLFTGQEVSVRSATTIPTGLAVNLVYFVIVVDVDNFKLASTLAFALAGTAINITSAGVGTLTVYRNPFKVYCNSPYPGINLPLKFIRVLYSNDIVSTSFTNTIRIMGCLWWDTVNHIPRGVWNQYWVSVRAATNDTYYFTGNAQFLNIVCKNNTTYNTYITGTWVGDPGIIEGVASTGVLTSAITAGGGVTCQLQAGEAANFTLNKRYFIYDFDGHSWVDYVKVIGVDTSANTILLQTVGYDFPIGSRIAAYNHRFYSMSTNVVTTGTINNSDNMSYSKSSVPYISATTGTLSHVFHSQTGLIRPSCRVSYYSSMITGGDPEDDGYYYAQIPILSEHERGDGTVDTTGLRVLGKVGTGELYVTSIADLTVAVTTRSVSNATCMYFARADTIFTVGGDTSTVALVQTESL